MSPGKTGIDLHRVQILNDGLAVLAFGKILLPAVEILLLANVRVAGAAREQGGNDAAGKQQPNGYRTTHRWILRRGTQKAREGAQTFTNYDTASTTLETVTGVIRAIRR